MIAPGRAKRPGAARPLLDPPSPDELASCPFCAGHEDMTPPQTLMLPEQGDWKVRVVPNLYPALERQEVVVHSRRHIRSIAEAERERRAKIINAEGEFQAAERLKDAAAVIGEQPVALQLRYLQTLLELGSSQATTIVFPVDLIRPFLEKKAGGPT